MFSTIKRNAALFVIAGLVVGGGAVAYAAGSPDRPTVAAQADAGSQAPVGTQAQADAQAKSQAGRARGARAGILGRVVHGDLIVKSKDGFQNVTYDRGKLQSVSGNSITIQRPDGVTVTVTATDSTKYRGVSGLGDLQTGKPTVVVSKDGQALMVGQRDKAGPAA